MENKRNRVINSKVGLALFRRNLDEYLRRYITVDESWIHYYTPETKEQSKQWVFKGDPAPKKAKTVKSTGKVMDTVFWDARGIIYVDYLTKGQTINVEYYASLLHRLSEEIKKQCPHLPKKKNYLPSRQCTGAHLRSLGGEYYGIKVRIITTPHPPYAPDLAP
ncbi:hypothetical protein AVEN_148295-1 [Araneus ventricosus]|uniref:Mariner Mos1 transposase n=1 Tax=Araneus ventricosus TaxID=182803 RepID=A0A4Y2FU56_ARAVE|nr:hypothetical protein AVEN_148295-1 [Araneus ventricosus]